MYRLIRAVITRFAGAAFTLLLAIYLARTIGATGSGYFYYALTLIVTISQVMRLGLDSVVLRKTSALLTRNDLPLIRVLNGDVLLFTILLGLPIVLIGWLIKPWFVMHFGLNEMQGVLYSNLLASILPFSWLWIYASTLRALKWSSLSVFIEVGITSLLTLLILLAFSTTQNNATFALQAQTMGIVFSALILLTTVGRVSGFSFVKNGYWQRAKRLYSESLSSVWVVISNAIIVWSPLLLLGFLAEPSDVGVYNSAFRVTMIVGAFSSVFKSIVTPKLAALLDNQVQMPEALRQYTKWVGGGLSLVLLCVWIVLGNIFSLFGGEFTAASGLATVMLFGQFTNVLVVMIETLLILDNRNDLLKKNAVFSMLFSLPLCWFLIVEFGVMGAAIGFSITNVVSRAGVIYLFNKSYSCRL